MSLELPVMVAVASGAGAGLGLLLIVLELIARAAPEGDAGQAVSKTRARSALDGRGILLRAAGTLVAVALVGLATRWPVAGIAAGIGVWVEVPWPGWVSGGSPSRLDRVARWDALAVWTESLAATLAAAAGLEQAIVATTRTPPAALAEPLRALGDAVAAGARAPDALAAFASDVDDASADGVVAALLLAATRGGATLREPLSQLAQATREQVTAARQVETGRTQIRTDTRLVAGLAGVVIAALVVFNRSFLTPYDGPFGQIVLAAVLVMAAAAFVWMRRLVLADEPARVVDLATPDQRPSW